MNMFEELKIWADKWGVKYNVYEQGSYQVITFDCSDNSEPTFNYDKETGWGFWQGGE